MMQMTKTSDTEIATIFHVSSEGLSTRLLMEVTTLTASETNFAAGNQSDLKMIELN
jgi:hypothetical protein